MTGMSDTDRNGKDANSSNYEEIRESVSRPVVVRPAVNVSLPPNPTRGECADGLWESFSARELVGSLLADSEQATYLRDSDEFHHGASYLLTPSSVKVYSALDNVKREKP